MLDQHLHHLDIDRVQENADPEVRTDLDRFFARLVPDGDALFRHRDERPDDMPAHVRSALTATSLAIPVEGGRMMLGTWQGIYLWEHRQRGHRGVVVLYLLGEEGLERGRRPRAQRERIAPAVERACEPRLLAAVRPRASFRSSAAPLR